MPLPRLGCGGPTHPAQQGKLGKEEESTSNGDSNPPKHALKGMHAVQELPIPRPSSKFRHAPLIHQERPLPRPGCGGPSVASHAKVDPQARPKMVHTQYADQSNQKLKHESPTYASNHQVDGQACAMQEPKIPNAESGLEVLPLSRPESEGPTLDIEEEKQDRDVTHMATELDIQNDQLEEEITQGMLSVCRAVEAHSAAFQRGCVPGFSTGIKRESHNPDHAAKRPRIEKACATGDVHDEAPAQAQSCVDLEDAQHIACQTDDDQSGEHPEIIEIFLIIAGHVPRTVQIPWGQTAGQLLVAHAKETNQAETDLAINTATATQIPLSQVLAPGSVVVIDHIQNISREGCQAHLPKETKKYPCLGEGTREQLLWKQKGWVAMDEMGFYTQMLTNSYPGKFCEPRSVGTDDVRMLTQIVIDIINLVMTTHTHVACVPILVDGHWIPIGAMPYHDKAAVWTTRHQGACIREAFHKTVGDPPFDIFECAFPQRFQADCGFQTVGWFISLASLDQEFRAVHDQQAAHWRMLFHQHLIAANMHDVIIREPIPLGGTNATIEELIKLITTHGVAPHRSLECADMIMSNLGASTVQRILKSPKPWADLKARTSLCKPSIRIVLPEELQTMLKDKAMSNQPVGRKNNKLKNAKPGTADIRLRADQILVPQAVFKQQDGAELGQLTPCQINASAKGILVVNYDDAHPYFAIQQAMTTEGLGLLVLDHHDPRLPQNHTVVRVPALCKATAEPLIATAALFQLGQKTVLRNLPEECIEVQETPYAVIRIAVYRDQTSMPWDAVTAGPVKQILQQPSMQSLPQNAILDVWDRQFLDERLKKTDPAKAAMVMVNIRLDHKYLDEVLTNSGSSGCYMEQRTSDGRAPHPDFQVVWLPKKSFAEATVAQQSNKVPCKLARSGNRYGLRVAKSHAEQTHMAHRPDVVYLQGNDLLRFKVGPLPYGSNKTSIATLFRKWKWQARPLGPIGPTRDKSGIMWQVQSTTSPENWIYQASHGDILITPDGPQQTQAPLQQAIIASDKTLQSLAKHTPAQPEHVDPWLHDDPWKSLPATASTTLNAQQLAEIEDSIEKKLTKHLQQDEKMDVDADRRVADLETKVTQIAQELSAFQHHQNQQQQTVQHQVAAIDAKVDKQQQAIHNLLDNKLEAQMARIEQLFAKRAKTGQE